MSLTHRHVYMWPSPHRLVFVLIALVVVSAREGGGAKNPRWASRLVHPVAAAPAGAEAGLAAAMASIVLGVAVALELPGVVRRLLLLLLLPPPELPPPEPLPPLLWDDLRDDDRLHPSLMSLMSLLSLLPLSSSSDDDDDDKSAAGSSPAMAASATYAPLTRIASSSPSCSSLPAEAE